MTKNWLNSYDLTRMLRFCRENQTFLGYLLLQKHHTMSPVGNYSEEPLLRKVRRVTARRFSREDSRLPYGVVLYHLPLGKVAYLNTWPLKTSGLKSTIYNIEYPFGSHFQHTT